MPQDNDDIILEGKAKCRFHRISLKIGQGESLISGQIKS
jgi:hypothetical protein